MIAQRDDMGCAVACVANLLNVPYQQALQLFDEPKFAENRGYYCFDITAALAKVGVQATYAKLLNKKLHFKPGTIVFIARDTRYPEGHFLLKTEDGWIDPWINLQEDRRLEYAKAGIRKRLPGQAEWAVFATISNK